MEVSAAFHKLGNSVAAGAVERPITAPSRTGYFYTDLSILFARSLNAIDPPKGAAQAGFYPRPADRLGPKRADPTACAG